YFSGALSQDSSLAIVGIDAQTMQQSRYIAEELRAALQRSGKFRFVERENLDRIMDELDFQSSGLVDDESIAGLGHFAGAETLIYGNSSSLGSDWRLTVYASAVRSGESLQQTKTVRFPPQLESLAEAGTDAAIDRAVYEMGRSLSGRKTIALGRISLHGTQSVTDLSNYLVDRITESALARTAKYRIAGKTSGQTQALVEGSFIPLDGGAEVTLRLVSASEDKTILGSSRFAIPAADLERRRLSVYPPEGEGYVTPAEAERLQKIIERYDGGNNAFKLTVGVDHPTGIYYDQEYLNFNVFAEKDCYIRISQVDIHGRVQVIYPLSEDEPNFIKAGSSWTVPAGIDFQVSLPRGVEYILVAAFEQPFAIEKPKEPTRITNVTVSEGFKARALTRRENTQRVASSGEADMDAAATAQCTYTILPRN
ncbi:MAG: DUF4384 domain-containing protein, partial [Treponema sp.]|nr:DUF4384 domain-containing protein [Treponema sp.]